MVQRNRATSDDLQLREVEATVTALIIAELVAQHELGAHPDPVTDCPICRAHAPGFPADLPLSA